MNHRNRRAPIALAGDAPILDAIRDGGFAEALTPSTLIHAPARFGAGDARIFSGSLHDAVIGKRRFGIGVQLAVDRADHGHDRQAIGLAEIEIALVMRGHGHDRSGAVVHQHKVADPDGHFSPL